MKATKVTSSMYGEIIATLKKAKRSDLIIAMEQDNVTIDSKSANILKGKAHDIIEMIQKEVNKSAEGDVEADLLLKRVIQDATEKFMPSDEAPVEDSAPVENTTEVPEEAPVEDASEVPEEAPVEDDNSENAPVE
jgi:hypothetical protein